MEIAPRVLSFDIETDAKGERLLADLPEAAEHGQAELVRSVIAELSGKLEESLAHAERAFEIGTRFGDGALQALALVSKGSVLTYLGELDRGLALLDEASTSALSGELDPFAACMVYCRTISRTHDVGDFERARQWTEAASRWQEEQEASGFPGACRIHRSEILWLGGVRRAAAAPVTASTRRVLELALVPPSDDRQSTDEPIGTR